MDDLTKNLELLHGHHFADEIGLVLDTVTKERVVGHLEIQPRHLQPFGIVHGGVYCAIVETLASMGAFYNTLEQGQSCAGIENHTSFLRSLSSGTVTAVALPVNIGRTTHLWDVEIRDEKERLVARGMVRLAVLERPRQA
jgi:uncharacterized protein (TIGR00369 family)